MEANRVVKKRSVVVDGHKTSVSVEDPFWNGLSAIATERKATISEVVSGIDSGKASANLSSAIRLFVLDHYVTAATASKSV